MSMVDLTDWTQTDGGAVVFERTAYRIHFTGLSRDESSKFYDASRDADYFSGNFTHHFTACFNSASASGGYAWVWGLSQYDYNAYGLAYADKGYIYVAFTATATAVTLTLGYREGGTTYSDDSSIAISSNYNYRPLYYTITKSTDTITLTVFSDPARTKALPAYTLTITHSTVSENDYQYLYLLNSTDSNQAQTITGWSGELYIDETPPAIFSESERAFPMTFESVDDWDNFETWDPDATDVEHSEGSRGAPTMWTAAVGGSATIAPSDVWSHSGTYSIKITSVEDTDGATAYFTNSVTTYNTGANVGGGTGYTASVWFH